MDTDKNGSYILLAVMLVLVVFFSYCSIPESHLDTRVHKVSKKTETKSDGIIFKGMANSHEERRFVKIKDNAGSEIVPKSSTVDVVSTTQVGTVSKSETGAISRPESESKPESKPESSVNTPDTDEVKTKVKDTDIIAMNNPLYSIHKKGIVQFTHKKHIETYAIGCGKCHHDDTGKPLDLSSGDDVQDCIECHKGTKKPKGEKTKGKKIDKKTRIMTYHFEALHANCIDCHKAYNIDKGDPKGKKPAPTACGKCHPKK